MSDPNFKEPTTNPFGLTDVGGYARPTIADIDGDGDLDVFVGNYDGNLLFYPNTGTDRNPDFPNATINPFGLTDVGSWAGPTFGDIDGDGDGDLDAFVNNTSGNTLFYRNTGTASSPAFASPSINPFGLAGGYYYDSPTFADMDGDGDLDALVGK